MNSKTDPLVTLAQFHSPVEAYLAKSRLELEGIHCFLSNEFSPGEVELRVASSEAGKAMAILGGLSAAEGVPASSSESEEPTRCLVCGSSFVSIEAGPFLWRAFRALILAIIPLPTALFDSGKMRCGVCGYRWKEKRSGRRATRNVSTPEQY